MTAPTPGPCRRKGDYIVTGDPACIVAHVCEPAGTSFRWAEWETVAGFADLFASAPALASENAQLREALEDVLPLAEGWHASHPAINKARAALNPSQEG